MVAFVQRSSSRPEGGYRAVPPPDVKAFPELLRAAGYYSFVNAKLDYQFSGTRTGSGPFTIWSAEDDEALWDGRAEGQPFFGMLNYLETRNLHEVWPALHQSLTAFQHEHARNRVAPQATLGAVAPGVRHLKRCMIVIRCRVEQQVGYRHGYRGAEQHETLGLRWMSAGKGHRGKRAHAVSDDGGAGRAGCFKQCG